MNDEPQGAEAPQQNLFLYEQPELLTAGQHGDLGMTPSKTPYAFAAQVRAVPLTLPEFWSAQRDYPIVFTNLDTPFPVAVVGVRDDRNLFMEDGHWAPGCYVPAYLRCHPFTFAGERDGRVAVAVDRAAATVTADAKYPFFVDGKISKEAEELMLFCARYEAERKRTADFCQQLKDLGLLAAQRATHTPDDGGEEVTLASYVSIDAEKLAELDDASLIALHRSGRLSAAYLQVHSLENWHRLMERRAAADAKAA